jgi:hypothetical protein
MALRNLRGEAFQTFDLIEIEIEAAAGPCFNSSALLRLAGSSSVTTKESLRS